MQWKYLKTLPQSIAKNETSLELVLSIISHTFLLIILALSPALIPPFLVFQFPIPSFPLPSKFAVSWAQLINFLFIGFHCRKMFSEIICPQFFSCQVISSKLATVYLTIHFLHLHSESVLMFLSISNFDNNSNFSWMKQQSGQSKFKT